MVKLAKLLGNRLRAVRLSKGLRQEDMEQLGISYKYYQRIESGKANITLATVEKLADALEVPIEELFTLPLSGSEEADELITKINHLIRSNDTDVIKKLIIVIDKIL